MLKIAALSAIFAQAIPTCFQKLEETVAENARLEQDLMVLRQKLQASRRYAGNIARDTSSTTAPLEAELRRVQQLVGDLQRQRKELSIQVRQLTEKSHSLVQQIRPQPSHSKRNYTVNAKYKMQHVVKNPQNSRNSGKICIYRSRITKSNYNSLLFWLIINVNSIHIHG
jgi:predicted nuclease with TOPRIM domain